jgi:hypothetical protein
MTRTLAPCLLSLSLLLALAPSAPAAEIAATAFPDTLALPGQELALAGLGIRSKFIVRVYAAGLYLPAGTADIAAAVFADAPKAFMMKFLYSEVEGEKLRQAWKEGFTGNTKGPSPELAAAMERFTALFAASALKGDEFLFTYQPGTGTRITLKGKEVDLIPGEEFMRAMMGIWFGPEPADGGLKKSVLAGKK